MLPKLSKDSRKIDPLYRHIYKLTEATVSDPNQKEIVILMTPIIPNNPDASSQTKRVEIDIGSLLLIKCKMDKERKFFMRLAI